MLAEAGRNAPCPCGSGRKFKRCCFGRAADTGGSHALVDRAVAADDWREVHESLLPAHSLFQPGEPLGHVRFRDDRVGVQLADLVPARLASPEWLARCEREIAHVLEHVELDELERVGLRLATYLLRRFGAKARVVEVLAKVQSVEKTARARRLADIASAHGLRVDTLEDWNELPAWIQATRPSVMTFMDWFTVILANTAEEREELWVDGISASVCDACCDAADHPECTDRVRWLQLASLALWAHAPELTTWLVHTAPRAANDIERRAAEAIAAGNDEGLRMVASEVVAAANERGDFAAVARLRNTAQRRKASMARTNASGSS